MTSGLDSESDSESELVKGWKMTFLSIETKGQSLLCGEGTAGRWDEDLDLPLHNPSSTRCKQLTLVSCPFQSLLYLSFPSTISHSLITPMESAVQTFSPPLSSTLQVAQSTGRLCSLTAIPDLGATLGEIWREVRSHNRIERSEEVVSRNGKGWVMIDRDLTKSV